MMYLSDITTSTSTLYGKNAFPRLRAVSCFWASPTARTRFSARILPFRPMAKRYFDREDNCPIDGEMKMEKTERGRIVTVKIPWREISPKAVAAGDHMGITVGAVK